MPNDGQERTEEATPRRRQQARRHGTVARSIDLTGSFVLISFILVLPYAITEGGKAYINFFRGAFSHLPTEVSVTSMSSYIWSSIQPGLQSLAPIVLSGLIVGLIVNFAQVGFVLSPQAMQPSLEKINPLTGVRRLFSARSFVEGAKAFFKMLLFGYLAYSAVVSQWDQLIALTRMSPLASLSVIGEILKIIMIRVGVAWLVLAALDYFFQRFQTDKDLRMTKEELKQEMREQDTSPEVRQQQARRRMKLAKGRLTERVKSADAVITNPTHFAVAVKYERTKMAAPVIVAKGQDYLALKIRELACQHKIPIVPNPPLARALYKQCEVGDFVPRDMFQAVAEVLAYVYGTLKKIRPHQFN